MINMLTPRNSDDYNTFKVETNMGVLRMKVTISGWSNAYTFYDGDEVVEEFDDNLDYYDEGDSISFNGNWIKCDISRPFTPIDKSKD